MRLVLGPKSLVLHTSRQIRPKKGLKGFKKGHVCSLLAFSGLYRFYVKGSNRPIRLQAGVQGLTELGLSG